jgi:very-short-patch-repair endonuclease
VTDIKLCGFEVDAYFPEHKVIVELDSWKYHGDPEAFVTDRERDRITAAAGLQTLRLPDDCLTAKEAAQLRAILRARRAEPDTPGSASAPP